MRKLIIIAAVLAWGAAAHAQPIAQHLKEVYSYEALGSQYISGVWVQATLALPDSATMGTVPYSTYNGVTFSTTAPSDSASSDTNGKVSIKLPLTSEIYPGGCTWKLEYFYKGQPYRPPVNISTTTTTAECLQKVLGYTTTCP